MPKTRFGPFGVVIVDGLTILYHHESGSWQYIGEYESPTQVPAVKVTTLDVTQDGVYDFVVEMAGFGAMRPVGSVLVQAPNGAWYWAEFLDPTSGEGHVVRENLRLESGRLVSYERGCEPNCIEGGVLLYRWDGFNSELGWFIADGPERL